MDTERTDEICTALGEGVMISNQVQVRSHPNSMDALAHLHQFSLIDQRPTLGMADMCHKHGLKLLTYGTLVRSDEAFLSNSSETSTSAVDFSPINISVLLSLITRTKI